MVFYDEAEARKLYERYKLQWMVYHGLGLVDLMDCMEAMIQEDLPWRLLNELSCRSSR